MLGAGTIQKFCIGLARSSRTRLCARRILASVHCAFSTCRLFASRVQSFRALRSRSAARALNRHDPISRVLSNFRDRLQRRSGGFNRDRAGSGGSTRRRFRLHPGRGRRMGGTLTATSSCAIRETAARKHRPDRRDPNRIRSFHAAGQHGRAHVRIGCRVFSRAPPRTACCSRRR